ncbi:MAG: family 10 glycosylhydrolase, partial [Weeksellaceae bacterium]|nr:family 10 glycosylhydrolase [Weeksellaceae bacterium]
DPNPPTSNTLKFPKKEMRGVWIASAWGLDWPRENYNEEAQKSLYISYLEKFKELKINAVFFQVRAMGDAFYASQYEPWSVNAAGQRGRAANYDILKFMIDEAHARGIEFHAWVNPFRVATRANTSQLYPDLHSSIPSNWVLNHEKIQIYNPGKPEVRQRLADILKELVQKYEVDGIHFDDYFYPSASSAGTMQSDAADYQTYGAGHANIESWRRSNVDATMKIVSDMIKATKPAVVFSVSPAPNHQSNFNNLFADVPKWGKEGWVDVIMPQLYQEIGNPYNDFRQNLAFWSQNSGTASVMIGYGLYKFGDPTAGAAFQSPSELIRQFELTRSNSKVFGHAMYSAKTIMSNPIGITQTLKDLYAKPAVIPFLGRSIATNPSKPTGISISANELKWTHSAGNMAVVYYFPTKESEGEVLAITENQTFTISKNGWYCVTALNADNKESEHTDLVEKK